MRLRIRYEKRGPIRFTSHRDLLRIFRRSFAAGGIPLRFSQGFNPHPLFSFGPSLRTGWESLDEYMDVFLEEPADDVVSACNTHLPDGLRILTTAPVGKSVPKLSADVKAVRYSVILDANVRPEVERIIDERAPHAAFGKGDSLDHKLESALRERFVPGSAGEAPPPTDGAIPLPVVEDISVGVVGESGERPGSPIQIDYLSTMDGGRSVPPEEVVTPVVGDVSSLSVPMRVTRTGLFVKRRNDYLSPIDSAVVE